MSQKLPRIRMNIEPSAKFVQVATSRGGIAPGTYYSASGGAERQALIESQGHRRPYRQTGSFFQSSQYVRYLAKTQDVTLTRPLGTYQSRADGMVCVSAPQGYVGTLSGSLPSVAAAASAASPYQAIGWNRTRPTKPIANAITALGELAKDGLPRIPGLILGDALRRLPGYAAAHAAGVRPGRSVGRSLGSEYLNYDFGWRPMVDDALKLLEFQQKFQQRINRWRQANGRNLRSRITLLDENTTTVTGSWSSPTNNIGSLLSIGGFGTWTGNAQRIEYRSRKVWFAAGYRIRLPALEPDNIGIIRAGLLGGLPTPSQVWDLMPWSWMLDWFGNVGDVLQNLYDPLGFAYAASYACIMQRTEVLTEMTVNATQTDPGIRGTTSVVVGANSGTITKYRGAASPYGFGLTWEGMNARQLATAAALGISRA